MSPFMLGMLGKVSPGLREVAAVSYQFTEAFVVDSAATEAALGVRATAWEEALDATVEHAQQTRRNITVV